MNHWDHLFPRLFAAGITIQPFTWIKKIEKGAVLTYNVYRRNDLKTLEDIDNVVLITGRIQNNVLYQPFKNLVTEIYLVGDANVGGARIGNAIYDGQMIGRSI